MLTHVRPAGRSRHSPNPDQAARQRADRLAKATPEQTEKALAYLSMIDPEAFEIAFTAVTTADDETPDEEEPVPVCRRCGAMVAIFPDRGLRWRHFRGTDATSGAFPLPRKKALQPPASVDAPADSMAQIEAR